MKYFITYVYGRNDGWGYGWGFPLGEHKEVIEIERMTAKKKVQERGEDGKM